MNEFPETDIKKTNLSNMFQLIYLSEKEHRIKLSKDDISRKLNLSLPTITRNLRELLARNLIIDDTKLSSKGGRKAIAYSLNASARYAIGVEILKQSVTILSVDLLGDTTGRIKINMLYQNTDAYYIKLAEHMKQFVADSRIEPQRIQGIGIGIQGLISHDGSTVLYGKILNCTGLTIERISQHVDYPCRFFHDADCVAAAEQWKRPDLQDAMILSVGEHLGGALLINGLPYHGINGRSGTIEHTIISPNGRECYCGKKGCVEAYCSLSALEAAFGGEVAELMISMQKGDTKAVQLWNSYLDYLALAINNFHMILNTQIIIGGSILNYLAESHLDRINELVKAHSAFPEEESNIILGSLTKDAVAIGAALSFMKEFVNSI